MQQQHNKSGGIPIEEISGEIINRLTKEFGGKISHDGKFWQGGRCPACGKKTLWTLAEKPLLPACNHIEKCGHDFKTRDHYPDLFERINERYQPTPANPTATADAYLRLFRGFDTAPIKGWYTQDVFDKNTRDGSHTPTVRFKIAEGVYWEKFTEAKTIIKFTQSVDAKGNKHWQEAGEERQDSNFIGAYGGFAWTPPTFAPQWGERVYLVEGIFDAIALYLAGYSNVASIMAAGNFPEKLIDDYRGKGIIWTFALDADAAGYKYLPKHIEKIKAQGQKWACISPAPSHSKRDWNDLYKLGKLTSDDMERYTYYGTLLTAKSPEEHALAQWRYTNKSFFVFSFNKQMYSFVWDIAAYEKAVEEIRKTEKLEEEAELSQELRDKAFHRAKTIQKLANCHIEFVYTENNPVDGQRYYTFRIEFADGRTSVGTMTGTQVSSATDFSKKLLDMASWAKFKIEKDAYEWLSEKWSNNVKHIETVAYGGYIPEHNVYVYPTFGVQNGRVIQRNNENYLAFSNVNAKSAYHDLHIEPNFDLSQYNDTWLDDLWRAWQHNGIVVLAYFTASIMAAQIRQKQKDFMFLELVGEAGTGKSTLIEFMWRLMGRPGSYEGFDPSASSQSFIGRSLASVSNLPTVFIEGDREEGKRSKRAFDWEETKKLFGGKSPFNRGVATTGNETYAPPYLGTLLIAQNAPVDASEAVLTRLVHIFTRRSDTNAQTFAAARRIEALKIDEVSGYLIKCLTNIDTLLDTFLTAQPKWESHIRSLPHAKTTRISQLHAQLCAAVECLKHVTPIEGDMIDEVQQHIANTMTAEREQSIKRDHIYIEQLMRVLSYIVEEGKQIDHYADAKDEIAIRLGDVYEAARRLGQELPPEIELTKVLKTSRRYVEHNKAVSSKINGGKTVRCWILRKKL